LIVNTLRTQAEQDENVKKGVSWTYNSKHLPDINGKSNAIDICPWLVFNLHGPDKLQWDSNDPAFQKIGEIGESIGLTWGGRWKVKDSGHFELR
jgi:peptidoglycan L-alanyl-D-glutamate endopeptidase CwlK